MRAIRKLPALGTARLVSCALFMTLAAVAGALGGYAAIARGDQTGIAVKSSHAGHRGRPAAGSPRRAARAARASRFIVSDRVLTRPSGSTVVVRGALVPDGRDAQVKLVVLNGRQWRTVATARTRGDGHFSFHYRVSQVGTTPVRVSYGGNSRLRASSAAAGRVVGLEPTVASWYYDAGNTACGFHATYGVANKTLPCGTRVTISYGGRSVLATVDDRGPYVYGRSFDLNQTTARYLGMLGVAQVMASV